MVPGDGGGLVELDVNRAEARAVHVPVGLLGHQGQVEKVGQGRLQRRTRGLAVALGQRVVDNRHRSAVLS